MIRWIDSGGAADRAGLRIGDRIVEVNGLNVEYENHQNLISVIGMCKNTAHFIVVDEDYDRAYTRFYTHKCTVTCCSGTHFKHSAKVRTQQAVRTEVFCTLKIT